MKNRSNLVFFLYFLIGVTIFLNSLEGEFVWDDLIQIVGNSNIHLVSKIPFFFTNSIIQSSDGHNIIYYRPLIFTTFNLIWNFAGNSPLYFKIMQLLFHILNSCFVFLILLKFYKKEISFWGGVIFLIHPINSEVVQYVASAQDIMFMFFGLGSFIYLINRQEKREKYWLVYLVLFISTLFSLGFKESGILFIIVLSLYILLFFKEKIVQRLLVLTCSLSVYLYMSFVVSGTKLDAQLGYVKISTVDVFTRFITVPKIIYYYFSKLLFPYSITVGQHWVVESITSISFIIPFILLIVVISIIVYFRKRIIQDSLLMFWLCWVVVGLGLHIHIIPLDFTVATRWFYFPFVGLLGVCAHLLDKRVINFKSFNIFATIIVIILSARTFVRNTNWKDEYTLYKHDLNEKGMGGAYDLHNNLGKILYTSGMRQEGCGHFKKSTEAAPLWWVSWNNLGLCYDREGRYDLAEQQYKTSIKNGDYLFGYINYTSMLLKTKQIDKAIRVATVGSKLFPENMFFKRLLKLKN